jgi:thioredoxin reductase (NADPH)
MLESDAATYGLSVGDVTDNGNVIDDAKVRVKWEILSENIQNYIRSLNFKYRVRLREKDVTYINNLAKFVDAHTIQATDKKGVESVITASRFLVAVGGRPSLLECEGGELAISSDDIFSLTSSPGKTLCVGASYISLECAGFLNGLGLDVTVAIRSIILRGFDRECSTRIEKYMEENGVKFRREVIPEKLWRKETGQIQVKFSDGSEDTFDTVLAAVGRKADTEKLGLEAIGVKVNPKNLRIIGQNEQTDCPNVYAVGDVLDVSHLMIMILNAICITQSNPMLLYLFGRKLLNSLQLRSKQECYSQIDYSANPTSLWITSIFAQQFSLLSSIHVLAYQRMRQYANMVVKILKYTIVSLCRLNGRCL